MSNEDDYFEAGKLAGFQKGAAHERRAIIEWLRSVGGTLNVWADQIERGEHLRGDDE